MDQVLKLELTATGMAGIVPLVSRLEGMSVAGKYRLGEAVACGGFSLVFKAFDLQYPHRTYACKVPLVPYHLPALISREQIRHGRDRLVEEFEIMVELRGSIWPSPEQLVSASSPLFASAWSRDVRCNEKYLFMEWIDGVSIDKYCRILRADDHDDRGDVEKLLGQTIPVIVDALVFAHRRGFLYIDVKPQHIVLGNDLGAQVRIVDAKGAWKCNATNVPAEMTPAYLPAAVYERWRGPQQQVPDETWVIHAFGKTLLACCTNREIIAGERYSASVQAPWLSAVMREYIDSLLGIHWKTLYELQTATESLASSNTARDRPSGPR